MAQYNHKIVCMKTQEFANGEKEAQRRIKTTRDVANKSTSKKQYF